MSNLNSKILQDACEYIHSWLEFNFENSRLPGMSVAILHKEKVVYSHAFGYANVAKKERLTTEHAFRVASHSKMITATAIMQLKEQGKLRLDDTMFSHLPWFNSKKDIRIKELTIRQVLNHTAGILRDSVDATFWQLLREFPHTDELKKYIQQAELVYGPDEKFKYSNLGFAYLGLLIEAVSGISYNQFITKHIFKKLGLKNIAADLEDIGDIKLASGYSHEFFHRPRKEKKLQNTFAFSSATGLCATPEAMCHFLTGHFLGNESLLTDISKREMHHDYWHIEDSEQRYGLGTTTYPKKGWTLRGHGGGFAGVITSSRFDPKEQLVICVFISTYSLPGKISDSMLNIIDLFHRNTNTTKSKMINLKKFTGRFYFAWGPLDIIQVGDKLFGVEPENWSECKSVDELAVINENTLKIETANGYGYAGEHMKYSFDSQGKVKEINYGGFKLVPFETAKAYGWY